MTPALRPFFSFYGGKWRGARYYPPPEYDTIVEPFAGSAGYSLRYPNFSVRLFDIDPVIVGVWDYLIHVSAAELLRLPITFEHIDEVDAPQEARWLIGFWLNKAAVAPRNVFSAWAREPRYRRQFWGPVVRERIARQLERIRHWQVCLCSYDQQLDHRATWFIDPPYEASGRLYTYSEIDYAQLSFWCRSRRGQVIVCEQEGATWLPFQPHRKASALMGVNGKAVSHEVVWLR